MRVGLAISVILWALIVVLLSGCGYAFVYVQPDEYGDRVSLMKEKKSRVDSVYETAIETAESQVDPVGLYRNSRRR